MNSKDYVRLPAEIMTLEELRSAIAALSPEQLDYVCPKLVEWRERAIELQLEPAAMGAAQMRHWQEQKKLKDAWDRYYRDDINQEEFEGVVAEIVEHQHG